LLNIPQYMVQSIYMSYQKIKKTTKTIQWVDIVNPTIEEREQILKEFDFYRDDIIDAVRQTARSKMTLRTNYLFLELMVPMYNGDTGFIEVEEIDFLVGKNFLVTLHHGNHSPVSQTYDTINGDAKLKNEVLGKGAAYALYSLLDDVLESTYPMIDHLNEDLELLKRKIFLNDNSKETVKQILTIRRNITEMRKAMRGHASVLEHFLKRKKHLPFSQSTDIEKMFEELIDEATEIWESLETEKEMIEALEDANESLIAHRLNTTMKTLTSFSVILLPAGVMASMWGMNLTELPFAGNPLDFWIVLGTMGLVSFTLFLFFWVKQWLK